MDHPGRDFLTHTCRAGDHDPASGRRDPLQSRADGVDCNRRTVELVIGAQLMAEIGDLAPQPIGFRCAADEMKQAVCLERLFNEVDGTFANGCNGSVEVAVA